MNDFEPIESALEMFLGELVEGADDRGYVKVCYLDHDAEINELVRLGFADGRKTHRYYDGDALVCLTYSGITYFDRKNAWVKRRAAEVAGSVSDREADELAKLIVLASENKGRPLTEGFDTGDEDENEAIRGLHRKGLLEVMYADDVPWAVNVTDEGYDKARILASKPDSRIANKIASVAGSFVGSMTKEHLSL